MSEVKTSRKLLVSEIRRGDPCYTYSQRLRERFETEINVTVELAVSQADDWDWCWAASHLLTQAGYEEFLEIVDKAEDAQSDDLKELRELASQKREEAHAKYDHVLRTEQEKQGHWWITDDAYRAANLAYSEVTEATEAALEAARKITEARVNKIAAQTFAELYIGEEGTEEQTGNDKWYDRDDDYYEDDYDDSYDENEDY